jgi:hypothetical protein
MVPPSADSLVCSTTTPNKSRNGGKSVNIKRHKSVYAATIVIYVIRASITGLLTFERTLNYVLSMQEHPSIETTAP